MPGKIHGITMVLIELQPSNFAYDFEITQPTIIDRGVALTEFDEINEGQRINCDLNSKKMEKEAGKPVCVRLTIPVWIVSL